MGIFDFLRRKNQPPSPPAAAGRQEVIDALAGLDWQLTRTGLFGILYAQGNDSSKSALDEPTQTLLGHAQTHEMITFQHYSASLGGMAYYANDPRLNAAILAHPKHSNLKGQCEARLAETMDRMAALAWEPDHRGSYFLTNEDLLRLGRDAGSRDALEGLKLLAAFGVVEDMHVREIFSKAPSFKTCDSRLVEKIEARTPGRQPPRPRDGGEPDLPRAPG